MASKIIVIVSAFVAQVAMSQYLGGIGCGCGGYNYPGLGFNTIGYGGDLTAAGSLAASHGGGLYVVTSSIAPTGLGVASENVYEGTVDVCGNIPFLGTADVIGEFPTAGAGGINYGCGDGAVGITAEGGIGFGAGLGYDGLGYGEYVGYGCGCGCGAPY